MGLLGDWMLGSFGLGDAPVFMNQSAVQLDLSMYEVFATLASGGACVLNSRELIATPAAWIAKLAEQGITVWVSTPSFAHQQLANRDFSPATLPTLRTFLFCGEPLPAALAKKLRQRFPDAAILNTYGPTEATVATTWIEITDAVLAQHDPLPVGHAKPDCELLVTDGEICIVGDHVMRGYLNRADLNEQKLFVHADGRRGFRTGDLGQMEGGRPAVLPWPHGRSDQAQRLSHRTGGNRRGAARAARRGGRRLRRAAPSGWHGGTPDRLRHGAAVAGEQPAFLDAQALSNWKDLLAQRLPPYMVPSELVACPALPMSNNHKIDRKKLLDIYAGIPV